MTLICLPARFNPLRLDLSNALDQNKVWLIGAGSVVLGSVSFTTYLGARFQRSETSALQVKESRLLDRRPGHRTSPATTAT